MFVDKQFAIPLNNHPQQLILPSRVPKVRNRILQREVLLGPTYDFENHSVQEKMFLREANDTVKCMESHKRLKTSIPYYH